MSAHTFLYLVAAALLVLPAEGSWRICPTALSDGPSDADVEVRIGNLPPSTPTQPVYLHWWAAKKSVNFYSPLQNPEAAQVYDCPWRAYAEVGDPAFNGGKVQVSTGGEATVRVRAPSTYSFNRGGRASPHVHFALCGPNNPAKKVVFRKSGVAIKSGCSFNRYGAAAYTVVSAVDVNTGVTASTATSREMTTTSSQPPSTTEQVPDWDALEFSSVYQCLGETKLYNQFSSSCASRCPAHAAMARAQCARQDATSTPLTFTASWRMQVDCNEKCWADSVSAGRHSVRLAVADHLDIIFQEAHYVRFRKEPASPSSHAHLNITVTTRRLDADTGQRLLNSFLANTSYASQLLGLTVRSLETPGDSDTGDSDVVQQDGSDEYEKYYTPLEQKAEDGSRGDVAGVEVPSSVPVVAIVLAAVAVVIVTCLSVSWVRYRRHRQMIPSSTVSKEAKSDGGCSDDIKETKADESCFDDVKTATV